MEYIESKRINTQRLHKDIESILKGAQSIKKAYKRNPKRKKKKKTTHQLSSKLNEAKKSNKELGLFSFFFFIGNRQKISLSTLDVYKGFQKREKKGRKYKPVLSTMNRFVQDHKLQRYKVLIL